MAEERDDAPDFSQGPPVTASVAAASAAAEAARGFQLASRAYHLDQFDIVDPSVPAPAGAGASRPTEGDARVSPDTSGQRPAPAPADPFTPDVLREAAQAGVSEEEARAFGDPAHLRRAVAISRRHQRPAAEPQWQPEPEGPALLDLGSFEYPPGAVDPYLGKPLTGKEYDPRLVEAISQRDKFYQAEIAALKQQVQGASQAARQAAQEQVNQRYDAAFAAVPDEYKAAVGQGSYHALDETSPEYRTRMEVFLAAEGMRAAYAQARMQPPAFKTLFDRALRAVLGGQPAAAPQPARAAQPRDPDTQRFLMRPTQRQNGSAAKAPTEQEHRTWAIGRLAQRMREAGIGE